MSNLGFNVVSSGSKGNSTILWDSDNAIVIDFGISVKRFRVRMNELNIGDLPMSILITHEHGDHSSGLRAASHMLKADVYLREKTKNVISLDKAFSVGDDLIIGNFYIKPLSVSHDAVDPVGYVIENKGRKISLFSDLGYFPMDQSDIVSGSDILAIESNHDTEMLRTGPYPETLKKRIMSNHGHMSNEQCSQALEGISDRDTRIVLLHLSDENNTPETAYLTARDHLNNREVGYRSIECAKQLVGSSIYWV